MSYQRVMPRDLFNEGDLLNCLGMLWIKLDERRGHRAELVHVDGAPFVIEQDSDDGSISCSTVLLNVAGEAVPLFRGLNSRYKWPLWARFGPLSGDFEDVQVFDPVGDLSTDFWDMIKTGAEVRA